MNWWGNSFDKAYGFSNIASNALKKAQKKIDKVLDIPTEEELGIYKGSHQNSPQDVQNQEDNTPVNKKPDLISGFSDISLKSPEIQLSDKNELVFTNFDEPIVEGSRLGDWNVEESLTASQLEKYCDPINLYKPLIKDIVKSESSESLKFGYQISPNSGCENEANDNCSPVSRSDRNTPILASDSCNVIEKDHNNYPDSTCYSHLSISSDCTTSTVKKVCSDLESSGHTDDFTSINNDVGKSDSSFINDDGDDETGEIEPVVSKSHVASSPRSEKKTMADETLKVAVCHSISVNSACKDDIDSNTTSSDIEPLSCATSTNGDNHQYNSHMSSRYFTADYMKHQRSASGSSLSIIKVDNCDDSSDGDQFLLNQNFQKQFEDLTKKLDIRESKMIQLSRENIDLRDTINNLTRQIEQMNERQETDTTDINALTREFTTRLSDAEKRYQFVNKEREQLKKYVSELKNTESQQIERVIKEKEEQVASLLLEGEKLAQHQLKSSNTIKKLRITLKEQENEINLQNQKIVKFESEITHLKKVLDNHEDNERKHIDGITQLTKAVEKLEKENSQLNNAKEMLQDRNRCLEGALDKSSHELVKLRKHVIELESEKISIENNHKSLINQQADKTDVIVEIKMKLEQGEREVILLQKKIQTQAREFSYKEDEYNSRISYLLERVAEMEQRQEELNEGASAATRPILRQLEALQNNCFVNNANWERNENTLNMKLNDLQQKLSIADETCQTYKEQLQSRDFLTDSLRDEKNRILNQYNQEYISKQVIIDEKMILEQKLYEIEKLLLNTKENYKKDLLNLEYKVSEVQHKLELEKQNSSNLSAKLTNMQLLLDNKQEKKSAISRHNSTTSMVAEIEPDDSVSISSNKSFDTTDRKANGTMIVFEQFRQQGVAVMMEHLEASLKQKEGQINKFHREIENMSRSRDSMIEEMTILTQTIERLENKLSSQQSSIDDVSGLNDRYNALLQMYGEKLEECEELRMDISEMKEVYRSHIDMLSKSNEVL